MKKAMKQVLAAGTFAPFPTGDKPASRHKGTFLCVDKARETTSAAAASEGAAVFHSTIDLSTQTG
jgi:hypothetical protein